VIFKTGPGCWKRDQAHQLGGV